MTASPPLQRLILHIGFQKTGTSSLQHFLYCNRKALLDQGILYPQAGTEGKMAHHQIALQVNPLQSDGEQLDAILAALEGERGPPHHTLLLSSEAFQLLKDFDGVDRLITRLNPGQVLIVAYVREFLDFRFSAFRQRVQSNKDFQTLQTWLKWRFDIASRLEGWRALGDLNLKWYDRDRLSNGDIIQDMVAQCGIDIAPLDRIDRDLNPSLGGNLMYFSMAAQAAGARFLPYNQLRKLAEDYPEFRAPFYFSDADAARARTDNPYNAYLYGQLGPPAEKSWDSCQRLPDRENLERDLERIAPLLDGARPEWITPPPADIDRRWFGLDD